jgi:hypothetical protein
MDQQPDCAEASTFAFADCPGNLVNLLVTVPFQADVRGVCPDRFRG